MSLEKRVPVSSIGVPSSSDGSVPQAIQATTAAASPEASSTTPAPLVPPAPVVPATLVIDPGHGGADGGTVGNGLIEKDWTLKVGLALAAELRSRGHTVTLTRESDVTVPIMDRPSQINAAPRIALISIHFNAGSTDATGVETWYSWPKKPEIMARLHDATGVPLPGILPDDGQQLAQAVQQAVQKNTRSRDRGIKNREDMAITSRTLCPAILIECGFLSNASESRKIQEAEWRKRLVQGIADGYETWLHAHPTRPAIMDTIPPIPPPAVPAASPTPDAEH
jgi:N-acetylmuramoyl-L-alanine amidase